MTAMVVECSREISLEALAATKVVFYISTEFAAQCKCLEVSCLYFYMNRNVPSVGLLKHWRRVSDMDLVGSILLCM